MQLYGALILFLTLSTASGLKCYTCVTTEPKSCNNTMTCPAGLDRCSSVNVKGLTTKTCLHSIACIGPITCCDKDLCNSAIPTGPSGILLLVSSAIITLFL
ncbi:lymphocyte antigen 6G-like [Scomber scombrus]|uniref:lymphocyte antigen 6G-like n=1 Tax=Scomber scombrus TaxID=13677 RepID=UPI002DD9265C|nr:lymphocyte antigen 6G-like [Scomber scombrus]